MLKLYHNNITEEREKRNNNGDIPSWLRRGHERKPNFIVRSIYWCADWLGDFKHLINAVRRGAGHVGSFFGFSTLLMITILITIFIALTSAIHSFDLLKWIGFKDWTAYPILFVVEAIFLIGSIQMDLAMKHGAPLFSRYTKWKLPLLPSPPVCGFAVGLTFVLFSNVMSLSNNIGGKVFGVATPALLIIAKGMLAWQYSFKSKIATKSTLKSTNYQPDPLVEIDQPTYQKSTSQPTNNQPIKLVENEPNDTDDSTENRPTNLPEINQPTYPQSTKQPTSDQPIILVENRPTHQPEEQDKSIKNQPAKQEKLTKQPTDISTKRSIKNQPTKLVENQESTVKKSTKNPTDKTTKWALKLLRQNGKLPSRTELMKKANCTQYQARKILSELKQQTS